MKIGFLFGAGAELGYNMPSGGKFALDIFRQDVSTAKEQFKTIRGKIDPTTHYASTWLPNDYATRSIGTYGKSVFENIIKDTIEHNRDRIIGSLNAFDDVASKIADEMSKIGLNVDESIKSLTGREPDNISMKHSISFAREFEEGDKLFENHYFSSLLFAYKEKDKFANDCENRAIIRRVVLSILQLQIGALSENLSRRINENPFKQKDDSIDIFDDLGEIIRLNYQASGVSGLEYLLEAKRANTTDAQGIIAYFAQELLETIFASVLDYKTLIDSNWHYLYCPNIEWNKFCKISIFLFTVRDYIERQCRNVDINKGGYYDDLKEAIDEEKFEVSTIATTNYTSLITTILGKKVHFLNGSTEKIYDPYINRIMNASELGEREKHFYVPLMFTQSGTKPMTSIEMSIEYVTVYNSFKDSDLICSVGFGFNPDDEHINGVIRTLVDEGKRLVVVEPKRNTSQRIRSKEIAEKLKVTSVENVKVIYVDNDRKEANKNQMWTECLISV